MLFRYPVVACAAVGLLLSVGCTTTLAAEPTTEHLLCQKAAGTAMVSYLKAMLSARQACRRDATRGVLPASVDCLAGPDESSGDERTDRRVRAARTELAQKLARKCVGLDLEVLGWPGFCDDLTGPPHTILDHEVCMVTAMDDFIAAILDVQYPPLQTDLNRRERICQDDLANKAAAMVTGELDGRARCLVRQAKGLVEGGVNCRAEEDVENANTGDLPTDKKVDSAHAKILHGLANSCPAIDLAFLGFPDQCVNPEGSVFSLAALLDCLFAAHHGEVFRLLDIAHPLTSPCGNGLIEVGELCDDGDREHAVGELCRANCSSVNCGDPDDSRGDPTIIDSLYILRTTVGLQSCALEICDVDSSGEVSLVDALIVLNRAAGIDVELNCPRLSLTCGNGSLDLLEECDDGDSDWNSGELCNRSCERVDCGDPNDSGAITTLDASFVLRTSIGLETCDLRVCDTTGNASIDSSDALLVLKKAVGLPILLTCPF